MKIEHIMLILVIHWVADFLMQTEAQATNKSKDNYWLLTHVSIYSFMWLVILLGFRFEPIGVLKFTLITFIAHFITDYFTSRWTSKLYKKGKFYGFPAFFSVIGLDQILHYIQLIVCFLLFIKELQG
jgi:hypothetical protein